MRAQQRQVSVRDISHFRSIQGDRRMPPDTVQWPSPEEIRRWSFRRQPHEREPVPQPGEHLLLRETDFGEAVPAVVAAVQDTSSPHDHWNRQGGLERTRGPGEPDPHVWSYDEHDVPRLRDDPWPWVQVQVITGEDENGEPVLAPPRWTREARVRGSAGWLRAGTRAHTGRYESGA
jgi:hypothetical protein